MMPLSGWVLALAAILTSPALWSGLVEGTLPLDVTLTRYLLAAGATWLVLSMVADLIWPSTPQPVLREQAETEQGDNPG